MKNRNIPSNTELPSSAKLVKSTILAICIAAIILVTVVLPAEYGLDPTGVGSVIGLSRMGEIKASLSQEAEADRVGGEASESINAGSQVSLAASAPETAPAQPNVSVRQDSLSFSLVPNQGKEIKLAMKKGELVNYSWWTDGDRANFDAHADSKALEIRYHNYSKGKLEKSEGTLEAAFDGKHGWFWRNRTDSDMTVTLKVSGQYSDLVEIK